MQGKQAIQYGAIFQGERNVISPVEGLQPRQGRGHDPGASMNTGKDCNKAMFRWPVLTLSARSAKPWCR
ncbi:hypothetical protein [Pseudomonas sp. H2_E05]